MQGEPVGGLGQAGLGRLAACVGHQPDDGRLVGQPAVGIERRDRVELAAGRADRARRARRLGIEDAVELAAEGAWHLACPELEERPGRPDPAQERADRFALLEVRRHGRDGAAATPADRSR